jgi:hypothetical protein
LGGKLVIRPASETLPGAAALKLVRDCEALMTKTVEALEIGEGLTWNRLLASLMGIENVGDVLVAESRFVTTVGAVTSEAAPGDLSVEAMQRLVPGTGAEALEVVLENRPQVRVSVSVDATIESPGAALSDMFQAELTQLLIAYLETVDTTRPDAALTHAGLLAALSGASGVASFPGQITAETVRVTVQDQAEGAAPELTAAGTTSVALGQNAILRSAGPAATVLWKEVGP